MKSASEVHFRIIDKGLFLPIARRLEQDEAKVSYWSPHERAFPTVKDFIGDGFPDIERVESPWQNVDSVDCFVFPDIRFSHLKRNRLASRYGERAALIVWKSRERLSFKLYRKPIFP
jgi:hypothetical protein